MLQGDTTSGYAFTGREWDAEIGLYYYRARYYDSAVGRFISEDPIGWSGGQASFYGYVRNYPTGAVDPSGLKLIIEGDIRYFKMAIEYLMKDPGMKKIILQICSSNVEYTLYIKPGTRVTNFQFGANIINWDPLAALVTDEGIFSPALALGHEMAHVNGKMGDLHKPTNDRFRNVEEKRVITGPEQDAARTLGEPIRNHHDGMFMPVSNPLARSFVR